MPDNNQNASAGHKLGQIVGDWFEQYVVYNLLKRVSESLHLFLDCRFIERACRPGKIIWEDEEGNNVDYDFVLELEGSNDSFGDPVAFLECFWRRGSRHSKDKARDDSGKLMPMRDAYPTARFLGIVAAGEFTTPARELVRSRQIDLFYVPKEKIIEAFSSNNLTMDYPDRLAESEKARIVQNFENNFTEENKLAVANTLFNLIGEASIRSYISRVESSLSALPQEIRFVLRQDSEPVIFETVESATLFLSNPQFIMDNPIESYIYQVTFSDGHEFNYYSENLNDINTVHKSVEKLVNHINNLLSNN